ncbi:hypothetical protein POM88_008523 [Heracleum sosnowskyi]|uniref:DUF4220 domain-containing protein n=1 Tax=Heracleum sosnowskyi TaxID=360622 RepID=A0AAD8J6B8_9APIA|nr:hypothetical protein POM88_008523 [Heracleum sosnowskyi]
MSTRVNDPSCLKQLDDYYDEGELRVCILLSLSLQIFLTVSGTFRRLISHKWTVILLWFAYLLAEMIAIFGLGLIVSRQRLFFKYCKEDAMGNCINDHLHIFWAPFLLLHLGGPDTITAFAPEDNELWLRHVFYLASQCAAVAYAYYQFLQTNYILRIPTLLMFLCGIIKCAERTYALYYASANSFRNSMLSKPHWETNFIPNKEIKSQIYKKDGDALSHLQVLQYAFVYFTAFKGLVVDLILSIHERNQSREFFLAVSCEDAFRLVEVELNYLYDVLFTKLSVLHHKIAYFFRTLSFIAVVASFVLYHSHIQNHHSHNDVLITYILLIGAIVLEVIAFYMLLFTDWTVIKLKPLSNATLNNKSWKDKFLDWILFVNNTRSMFLNWFLHLVGDKDHHPESKFADSRWAGCLSTFNLIFYCLHKRSKRREKFFNYFGLVSFLNEVWYVKPQPLTLNITSFIFEELKNKSKMAGSLAMAKKIFSSKGEWVLERVYHEMGEDLGSFVCFVANFNYDDILLVWHIATEVCYNDIQDHPTNKEQRETAKRLSDYMLYLMVMKPDMMSAISGFGEIKFGDTCTKVSKFFRAEMPELKKRKFCKFFCRESTEEKDALQRKACETILRNNGEVKTHKDRIFFNASALAKKLKVLPSDKKWLIISKLWVELVSYAASHIRTNAHAVQLSKGGELITVVWLLMAHFGLGDQYEINLDISLVLENLFNSQPKVNGYLMYLGEQHSNPLENASKSTSESGFGPFRPYMDFVSTQAFFLEDGYILNVGFDKENFVTMAHNKILLNGFFARMVVIIAGEDLVGEVDKSIIGTGCFGLTLQFLRNMSIVLKKRGIDEAADETAKPEDLSFKTGTWILNKTDGVS